MSDNDEQEDSGRGRLKRAHGDYAEQSDDDQSPQKKAVKKGRASSHASSTASAISQADDDDRAEEEENHHVGDDELTEFETGQILMVYCENFMCHHKLTIDFGRHVNFVTGSNGSGQCVSIDYYRHN